MTTRLATTNQIPVQQARWAQSPMLAKLPETKQQAVKLWANSPEPFWNSINPRREIDVFNALSPSIAELAKTYDDLFINALMYTWFEEFVGFYSTNGTMNPVQIRSTIDLVREEYPHYKPEDFKLFFKMARKGYFGKVYGRIDGEVIMDWLRQYDIRRDTEAQNESIREADYYNKRLIPAKETGSGMTFAEYRALKRKELEGKAV